MPGSWEPLQPFGPDLPGVEPTVAVHLIHLPNGKFLTIDVLGSTLFRLWTPPPITTPGRGSFEDRPNAHNAIFCSGHCAMSDGRILVAGGAWGEDRFASKKADVFDTAAGEWNPAPYPPPDMTYHRWYPTCTSLANKKVMVTLGRIHNSPSGGFATTTEFYDHHAPPGSWAFGPDIGIAGTYPFIFVLPDGRIFCAGPTARTRILDANFSAWSEGPENTEHPEDEHATAVMLEPGKIMKVGGSPGSAADAVNKVSIIDMTAPSPVWTLAGVAQMAFARRNHNLTLLPDGKVLITGGNLSGSAGPGSGPVREAELFDPVANTMTTLPRMAPGGPRWYHSTAGLLADGRVVAAGGNDMPSQQIFRPPYLDGNPARPVIAAAPASMTYAVNYTLPYAPSSMAIRKVVLIKLCSVTHGFCQDQRLVPLTIVPGTGTGTGTRDTVTVASPANANVAPPGYYMLFLVNDAGVPSTSVYVKVGP